ncbi:uncharacterized protein LOC111082880 [Drosophila obscura]|uniref:uncharacterized protein LOC111082880 n=1 Tax=Drosophila obscura TaxID=7282 RepID=UPI001BB147DD|nr:uncharacterized protein LOC111082880 [Drosophila obscura]
MSRCLNQLDRPSPIEKMFKWSSLILCVCLAWVVAAVDPLLPLNAKDFQLDFLRGLADQAEQRAAMSLNDFLTQLEGNSRYINYTADLSAARASTKLQPKVTLIKQLIDAHHHPDTNLEHISVLRNLVFLNRLKSQLRAARESSAQEIRQLRLHRLCQQFDRPRVPEPKHQRINDQTVGAALEQLNLTRGEGNTTSIDLNQFGQQLYERVKLSGAEIIDNYLLILRGLLQDIIECEHADLADSTPKLDNMLQQLDGMLATQDFFEKRQKVYGYLERHLTTDYEQLRDTPSAEQHLTEKLLEQLKAKGLDLFVIFLFSNFEFLEQVHAQWSLLLPQTPSLLYDDTLRQLYDLQQLYEIFKLDTESEAKYEAYAAALRQLHERTVEQGQRNRHIFELLSNAAQNVGSVTFNMIKAKCQELL